MQDTKRRADANASTTTLGRFPTVLVSRTSDTVVEVRGSAANPSAPSVEMSWAGSGAGAPPPAYKPPKAPIPTEPVRYGFVPTPGAPWRRVLVPPAGTPNAQALFVLAIMADPWTAWSQTVTLHDGPDEAQGKLAGFLNCASGMVIEVTMGEMRQPGANAILPEQAYNGEQQYQWNFTNKPAHKLLWVLKDQLLTCLHWNSQTKPNLRSSTPLAQLGGDRRHDEITLWPAAHAPALVPHVVLSAVAVRFFLLAPKPAPVPAPAWTTLW